MNPAPPFDCHHCGRRIGKTRSHWLLDDGQVICFRCMELGKATHAQIRPGCPHGWHDLFDHSSSNGTRAGIAAVLGMWP